MNHLYCERDQKHLISKRETGFEAREVLSGTYSSNDISYVMRIEELFSKAKMVDAYEINASLLHSAISITSPICD